MLPISIIVNIILMVFIFVLIVKLGGWNHFLYKIQNRGLAGTYQHRSELLERLPITSEDIVFLGNSLIQYCEWSDLFENPNIKNRGIAGDGVEGVLNRISPILSEKPKAVFLMIGVNDLFFHDTDYIVGYYKKIIEQCVSETPNTKLILQSVLPVNSDIKSVQITNKDIVQLNRGIQELSQEFNLFYLDLHTHFLNAEGKLNPAYSVDGIHINGEGYLIWKKQIRARQSDLGVDL